MSKVCTQCGTTYADASIFCPLDGSTLRPTDDSGDLIGTVIADRYLIMQKLGEGGMGRVYLAQHVRLPQQAAIKVLSPALVNDTDALARFNREASNACRINAANVARVYDFGETGAGLVYLAMEYVPGLTLSALLKAEGSLSPRRVANLVCQVAEGLEAAHKLGIVHRDLKPDNILVTTEPDGTELAKVVDFGIAKAIDGTGQSVTRLGIVLGTAQFMSPEQVSGQIVDRRTDVYALGLVAFMMLTGKLPFDADTAEEAMYKRLSEPPRTLAEERPDVDWHPAVQKVLDKTLAFHLNDRYATANEMAGQLRTAIQTWVRDSVAAIPRPARTNWSKVAAISGAAAVLVAAVVVLALRWGASAPPVIDTGAIDSSSVRTSSVRPPNSDSVPARVSASPSAPVPPPVSPPGETNAPRTPRRDSAATRRVAAPPPPTGHEMEVARARAELEKVVSALHPDVITSTSARDAILTLPALLPRLGSADDTVKAELNRAGAYVYLEQVDQACTILRALVPKTSARVQQQIEDQREALGCR